MSKLEIFLNATKDYVQEEREFYLTNNLLQILDSSPRFRGIIPQQTNLVYNNNRPIQKSNRKKNIENQKYANFRYFEVQKLITPETLSISFKLQEQELDVEDSEKNLIDLFRGFQKANLLNFLDSPKNVLSSTKALVWAYVSIPSLQVEVHPTKLSAHKLTFPFPIQKKKGKLQILNDVDFLALEEQLYETKEENRLVRLTSVFPNWKNQAKHLKENFDEDLDLYRVFPLVSTHSTIWENIYKALPSGIDLSEETTVFIVVKKNEMEQKSREVAKEKKKKSKSKSVLLSLSAALLIRMKLKNTHPSSSLLSLGTIVLHSKTKTQAQETDEELQQKQRKALEGVRKIITFNSVLSLLYLGLRKIRDNGIPTYLQLTADLDHKKISLLAENNFIVHLELIRSFFYPFSSCGPTSFEKEKENNSNESEKQGPIPVTQQLQKANKKVDSLTYQLQICKEKSKNYLATSETEKKDKKASSTKEKGGEEESNEDFDENIAEKILTRSHTSDIIDFVEKSS